MPIQRRSAPDFLGSAILKTCGDTKPPGHHDSAWLATENPAQAVSAMSSSVMRIRLVSILIPGPIVEVRVTERT
jgi:hypothetical protein